MHVHNFEEVLEVGVAPLLLWRRGQALHNETLQPADLRRYLLVEDMGAKPPEQAAAPSAPCMPEGALHLQ